MSLAHQQALASIPSGLRDPLIAEYQDIVSNYMERRWRPSELSGGRFCEIVYTILDGHAGGSYANTPSKPRSFVDACRRLEQNTNVPRSFQILIPRLLPALYEIRNNRNVGHVGGDVDPNHMDSVAVLTTANWIMAELVRVLHQLPSMEDAQAVVDALAERRLPLIWQDGDTKRVLDPKMSFPEQVLVLLAAGSGPTPADDLLAWTECSGRSYLNKLLRKLHKSREVEFNEQNDSVQILPPGSKRAEDVIAKYV
jgi:hypothetical protein